jgi:hypothetical protein
MRITSARPSRRVVVAATVAALAFGACTGEPDESQDLARSVESAGTVVDGTDADTVATTDAPSRERYTYPEPPVAPDAAEANPEAEDAINQINRGIKFGSLDPAAMDDLFNSGDARHAWFVSDLLRIFSGSDSERLVAGFERLTGVSIQTDPGLQVSPWSSVSNHLIAWDTPDYVGYREDKGALFTPLEDSWIPFFDDADADIDWRHLSWGGVFVDDRPLGDPNGCSGGCIPGLDDPATTSAAGGDWYLDERTVFGITVGAESLAIPLNIAEIHEMFNLTLGGRRLGIPYCSLCGSAQAYFTDRADGSPIEGADEVPVMRTSGLLNRSNKVMYDLLTSSVFDTFTGAAVSGSLQDADVKLLQTTVVRSTWAEWKRENPGTRIIAQDGGINRSYDLDPLGGRDDDGPIFPIGNPDGRLGVQEFVVGVILEDGATLAFPSEDATAAFNAGEPVELKGIELSESGDGLVAVDTASGNPVAAHEAFWFAWTQFHPDTLLWER